MPWPRPDPDLRSASPSCCLQASALCSSQGASGCSSWGGGSLSYYVVIIRWSDAPAAPQKQGLSEPAAEPKKTEQKCDTFILAVIFHELRIFLCAQKASFSAISEHSSFTGLILPLHRWGIPTSARHLSPRSSPVRWLISIIRGAAVLTNRFTRDGEQAFCVHGKGS